MAKNSNKNQINTYNIVRSKKQNKKQKRKKF